MPLIKTDCKKCKRQTEHYLVPFQDGSFTAKCAVCGMIKKQEAQK